MCVDIKNIYLATPMDRFEYMKMPISLIPDEFAKEYKLANIVQNGFVYMKIERGMYGLPQAGIITNKLLKNFSHHTATMKSNTHRDCSNIYHALSSSL